MQDTDGVSGIPTGLWDTLETSRTTNAELESLMGNLSTDIESYQSLKTYLLENPTGRNITDSLLYTNGQQTIVSFQASTLDWKDTVEFETGLSDSLADSASSANGRSRIC